MMEYFLAFQNISSTQGAHQIGHLSMYNGYKLRSHATMIMANRGRQRVCLYIGER